MEDKIIIRSKMDEQVKTFLQRATIALLGIAALIAIGLAIPMEYQEFSYWGSYTYKVVGWQNVFHFGYDTKFFVWFVLGCLCLVAGITIGIMYLVNRSCELQITENNVKGKTLLGKEVVLPLYMVSAYTTRKFLSMIAIATASGVTKFTLIGNYKEIGRVLSEQINARQKNTEMDNKNESPNASMDDLLKLKSLLDAGVITQEEFDAKKKQILGLE